MHTIGYASSKGELSGLNQYIRFFVGSVGNLGVGCFVLISGYFGVKNTKHKFLNITILTTLYAMLCAWVNNDFSINRNFIMAIISVPRYFNWYITCYLILMALSEYINHFVESLSKNEFRRLLIILFVFFSVLPMSVSATETVLLRTGQCLTYFIYAYLIGRYIRLHRNNDIPRRTSTIMALVFVTIMFLTKVAGIYVSALYKIPMTSNNSPFILGAVICVFYLFKSFNFKSTIINFISSSVLAAYLLDDLRPAIDKYIHVYSYNLNNDFAIYVALETILIFTMAVLVDKTRILIFGKIEKVFIDTICVFYSRINRKLAEVYNNKRE